MPDISIKDEHMWRLAGMLAFSGAYDGWLEIEHELSARGFSRAHQLLGGRNIRERLNRECTEARKKHPNVKSSGSFSREAGLSGRDASVEELKTQIDATPLTSRRAK